MSGIVATDDTLADFEIFQSKTKSKAANNERSWIVWRIKKEEIVKDADHPLRTTEGAEISQEELWESFCTKLSEDPSDAAYGAITLKYETRDGRETDGLVFIKFQDEDKIKIKAKMLYGSTMQSFKAELNVEFKATIEANSRSDLDLDELLQKLGKKK